jgi:hypothetical protein
MRVQFFTGDSHGSQLLSADGHSSVYVSAIVYSRALSADEVPASDVWGQGSKLQNFEKKPKR